MTVLPVGKDMEPQLDLALQARHWVRRDKPGPHRLMCAMADEIERLRALADRRGEIAVNRRLEIERLRLTGEEREAVKTCIADDEAMTHYSRAATLRGLLDRLGHQ